MKPWRLAASNTCAVRKYPEKDLQRIMIHCNQLWALDVGITPHLLLVDQIEPARRQIHTYPWPSTRYA
jgi:hypothetical protein